MKKKFVRFPDSPDFENYPDFQTERYVWYSPREEIVKNLEKWPTSIMDGPRYSDNFSSLKKQKSWLDLQLSLYYLYTY